MLLKCNSARDEEFSIYNSQIISRQNSRIPLPVSSFYSLFHCLKYEIERIISELENQTCPQENEPENDQKRVGTGKY